MQKTFKLRTINGHDYQLLTLPGTNLFQYEVVNMMGSNIERVLLQLNGNNVFGISHFIEHLGFRVPRDFSTNELLSLLKTEGTYNASTDHDRINYFFKTTMDRIDIAVKLVCNYAFNDLKRITPAEFETEKMVVYNEAKRYADDDQTMFYFNTTGALCGYDAEDNVIGIADTIEQFTLKDAIAVKDAFMQNGRHVHNVTYDPAVMSEEEVVAKIEDQLATWTLADHNDSAPLLLEHNAALGHPRAGEFLLSNESEQHMTAICLDVVDDISTTQVANAYLSQYADSSLTDVIREQNGLTYGIYFADSMISYKPYTMFMCDVTKGTEDRLMQLFEESINTCVDNFTEETHEKLISTIKLQHTLSFVNQERYNSLHWLAIWHPHLFKTFGEKFEQDAESGFEAMRTIGGAYENVSQQLKKVQMAVNAKAYGIVTN